MFSKEDNLYSKEERDEILIKMQQASHEFYSRACAIGNHPFIEFTGLINEYIQACHVANAQGIDFTQCNKHTGNQLPLRPHNINYINEKLECIFTGKIMMKES